MKTKKVKDGICTHQEGEKTVTHYAFEHAASHTPGPWKVDDRVIKSTSGANVSGCVVSRMTASDARLIASAPELLEVLKIFANGYDPKSEISIIQMCAVRDEAKRVIAKAEGR